MTLGHKIRDLLADRGWSHYKLAEKTGIPRPTITAIANDKRRPSAESFLKLAKAFDVDVEELFVAAGYVSEARATYDQKQTPEKLLDEIRQRLQKLEHQIKEKPRRK